VILRRRQRRPKNLGPGEAGLPYELICRATGRGDFAVVTRPEHSEKLAEPIPIDYRGRHGASH